MNKRIAILGCGWLGLPVALSLLAKGYVVKGSTTSENKLVLLQNKGILPHLISISEDGIQGDMEAFLKDVSALIVNIPPKLRGANRENYVLKMKLLHAEVAHLGVKKLLFVSSTSVYGYLQGEVTEKSVPAPVTESGRQLLAAETIFTSDADLRTTIIRFGGLIAEDRHPVQMLSGRKNLENGNEYINLIHQIDCIAIIEYILKNNWWNTLVNGVYPYHPSKKTYYTSEALKRGLPPPEYIHNTKTGKRVLPCALLESKEFCFKASIIS